jgi:hypothetical protein
MIFIIKEQILKINSNNTLKILFKKYKNVGLEFIISILATILLQLHVIKYTKTSYKHKEMEKIKFTLLIAVMIQ